MRLRASWRVIGIAGLATAVLTAAVQMRNVQRPTVAIIDESQAYRPPVAIHGPVRMTVLGDSLGFGSGASSPQLGFTHQIFQQIRMLRGDSSFVNFAMPHATTREVIERQLPCLLADTNLVLLVTGSNDVKHYGRVGRFAKDYAQLLSQIRLRAPHAVVVAAGLLDISLAPAVPPFAKPAVAAFSAMSNAEIQRIAGLSGAHVIDYFTFSHALRHRLGEVMSGDGWHPSDIGHALMAERGMALLATLL